ncbi:MAG TPA: hypothetical protein PKY96_01000 [Flavobacteriales bacterium]|nr:hypothetical protein [Flavobacteriales bacterium]
MNLDLYLDCAGVPITPHALNFASSCGVSFSISGLTPVSVTEVSQLCPSQVANSTCNGGTQPSFRKYRFQTTLFLSPCNNWTIDWYTCCRNTTQNVMFTPGLYVNATLNNTGGLCDNSPVFNDVGIPYVCVNQPVAYNLGVSDPDAHTLNFSLVSARFATPAPTDVTYQGGYSAVAPIPGIVINPISGQLSFFPTMTGYFVVVVQVKSFTAGGTLIGTVMRDLMFAVVPCDGTPPSTIGLSSGTNGVSFGPGTFVACAGNSFCVSLQFWDPNAGQSITVTSNAPAVLPGATVTTSGSNPVTVTVCWTATVTTYPIAISFQATDNACPVANASSFAITALDCAYLPVELLDFTADPQPEGIALGWRTGSEHGTRAFVLERGTEPSRFDSIGSVTAEGSSAAERAYAFVDRTPINGLGYYRLRIIDWDGSEQWSPVVPVWSFGAGGVSAVVSPSGWLVSGAMPGGAWSMISLTGALKEQGRADETGAFLLSADGNEPGLLLVESGTERAILKLPMRATLEQGTRIMAKH